MSSISDTKQLVHGIDHVQFFVGNSFQTAEYYCSKFGFVPFARDGFQTGNKHQCTQVVKQQGITFCFTNALSNHESNSVFYETLQRCGENHVRDVAFNVDNVEEVYAHAVRFGAKSIQPPKRHYFKVDEQSTEAHYIETATIQPPFAQWVHTLVNRENAGQFANDFFPQFQPISQTKHKDRNLYQFIDHLAMAIEKDSLPEVIQWYRDALHFTRFFSADDDEEKGISVQSDETRQSVGLRTMVMTPSRTNPELFKFVFVEPVNTNNSKSQIQEFLDYHGGPGVAHLALNTQDIVECVSFSRQENVPFITPPHTYYSLWRDTKKEMYEQVAENWAELQRESILVDGKIVDDGDSRKFHYLLQTFTQPLQDRPTFYLEAVSRRGANGFGKGNIKSLFDAIEVLQKERGNFDVAK